MEERARRAEPPALVVGGGPGVMLELEPIWLPDTPAPITFITFLGGSGEKASRITDNARGGQQQARHGLTRKPMGNIVLSILQGKYQEK